MTSSLIDNLGRRELVAFVGGGGKSTLLLELGKDLAESGETVVLTTTTRMSADQVPKWSRVCHSAEEVEAAVAAGEAAFLLGSVDGSKVTGVASALVDDVFSALPRGYVLVEADGARRHPIKAPAKHEPVIPSLATVVIFVVGLDALDGTIAEVAHRPELVSAITGLDTDEMLTPRHIAEVAVHPRGGFAGVPVDTRVVVALTKVDLGPRMEAAHTIGSMIGANDRIDGVHIFPRHNHGRS